MFEAMLSGDDAAVATLLRPGKSALPTIEPNGYSLLASAQRTFANDRLPEVVVASVKIAHLGPHLCGGDDEVGVSRQLGAGLVGASTDFKYLLVLSGPSKETLCREIPSAVHA